MGKNLYKISLILIVITLLPLIFFLSRKEVPNQKIKIPKHKRQTVENFVLKSSGKNRWTLTANRAMFTNQNQVNLTKPILKINLKQPLTIKAERASYFRNRNLINLEKVTLMGKNFYASSPKGIYYLDKKVFKTDSYCKITFNKVNEIEGKGCLLNIEKEEITIFNSVKTTIKEVKNEVLNSRSNLPPNNG